MLNHLKRDFVSGDLEEESESKPSHLYPGIRHEILVYKIK